MAETPDGDWVARFADEVIAAADRYRPGKPIVCASGISPSGPIHLGNLREVLTPHLVADEIRRRGVACEHIISWDDFDRFRRVPATIDSSWSEHVGKPLTSVPAPPGSEYANWADHFRAPLLTALEELGVEFRGISQTAMYTSGAYTEQVLLAMRERRRIDAILAEYRTRKKPAATVPGNSARGNSRKGLSADDAAMSALALEGSGAADEDDGAGVAGYYPYKPYCQACDRDLTTITGYDDDTTAMSYTCVCGHAATVKLREYTHGKLVWKVDWPMRWAYEGVAFEPSGVDHSSPGSSYVVGGRLVGAVFGGAAPIGPMYAFVGMQGMAKMSSSKGGVPTPSEALGILEPQLLRWLYARKKPAQSITVSLGQELQRMYDEWDSLTGKVAAGTAGPAEVAAYSRASQTTSAGTLPVTPVRLPFGTLASVYDVTTGQREQLLRVLRDVAPDQRIESLDVLRPRLDRAARWVAAELPPESRTQVRAAPDDVALAALDETQRASIQLLLDGLDDDWSLEGLTTLVYGVPKRLLGLPMDVKPTPELRAAQRSFFALLYELLVGRDTGPRLPTLLLAIGTEKVRDLLVLPAA